MATLSPPSITTAGTNSDLESQLSQLLEREIPSIPTLTELASLRQPFTIRRPETGPYTHIFQPFSSTLSNTNATAAWALKSPFQPSSAKWKLITEGSGSQSYSEVYSTYDRDGKTHISAGLGVGIGNSVLGGSVSVQYDRTVTENRDGIKISKKSLVKSGLLTYGDSPQEQPVLSPEALAVLEADVLNNTTHFHDTYGDCFVEGLVVGAEAGVLFSQDNYQKTTVQVATITVTIKVLFMSFSESRTITDIDREAMSSFCVTTFDTMRNTYGYQQPGFLSNARRTWDTARLGIQAVDNLAETVQAKLQQIVQEDGAASRVEDRLLKEGLILEVVLVPYASLAKFVEVVEKAKMQKRAAAITVRIIAGGE